MDKTVLERLKKEIENLAPQKDVEEVGVVRKVGDGIVEIEGLTSAQMAEMVIFDESTTNSVEQSIQHDGSLYGLILNLEEDSVKAVVLGDDARVVEGMIVRRSGNLLSIPVGDNFVGRIVNPLAEAVDGKGDIKSDTRAPIEREAYGVIDRAPVE